jgi:hypothetical protein
MRKLKSLKVGGVQREEKKLFKKNVLWVGKLIFSSCYFFIIHFSLDFKDDFSSLK